FSAGNNGLRYSEIDMGLNGGLGDVTANKNILLHANTDQRMKAITHCNGQDIWVITHDATGDTFRAYLVTANGVSNVAITSIVGNSLPNPWFGGYMACSKDGTRIAIAGESAGANPWPDFTVELFYFDNQTGNLCNPLVFNTSSDTGGIEFSADGTKLYVCDGELEQFDISSNIPAVIEASAFDIAGSMSPGVASIMRGPDDKIYVTTSCQWSALPTAMHVINDPNLAGAAMNYQLNFIPVLPRTTGHLPTFYAPTQTINSCGPVLTALAGASNNTICITDCVTYTNSSSGSIVSYDWAFQGGTPAVFSGANPPQVCYTTAGSYTTTLTVTDCAGNTSSTDITINVSNCTGPQINFQADQTQFCVNNCTNFTDLSTGTNVNVWTWTFTGGNPAVSTDQNPQNICYAIPGVYDVTLEVTDDNGTNISTVTGYIIVDACIPPVADIGAPDTVCVGSCINLVDQSTNSPTTWNWTLNGGNPANSTDQNPQNICFLTTGTYTLELTASNIYGVDVTTKDIVVIDTPDAGADMAISWCVSNEAQDLELYLNPGVPLNGTWTNQNGTPAFTGSTFTPQLAVPGTYTIIYTLSNAMCTDNMEFTIDIQAIPNAGLDGTLLICDNDSPIDLVASVLLGNPDLNGGWTPALNSGTSIFDPSIDPSGVYNYIVPPNLACGSDSSLATLTITYVANVEITPVDALCATTEPFVLETNINGGTWAGSGIQNGSNTFDPALAGTGIHTVLYTIDVDNCVASVSIDIE
ncbi:MAG: PKD domain-containing protein, partial [Crocinitomicaceae bacterium]|nr:PKD domain-containing protein [Crocinitomicaceae bacterium]